MIVEKQPPRSDAPWSAEARSIVSLFLFAHLFALVVAVTTYTRPSNLQEQLHDLFDPYLRNLHITAYPASYPFAHYYLTHALPTDVDFSCDVEFNTKDSTSETTTIPRTDLQPLVRLRRYQALANAAGALADAEANEDFNSILPRAIAGSILKQAEATQGTVRLRAHYIPQMEIVDEVAAGRRTSPINDTYEAQVFISGGTVELLKKSTALEVAPVGNRRGTASGQARPPAKKAPGASPP